MLDTKERAGDIAQPVKASGAKPAAMGSIPRPTW